MSEIQVKYGIPQPEKTTKPRFKAQGVTSLRLEDFPNNVLPSGGMSGTVSPSEMFMIETCVPTTMTWKDNRGKVIATMSGIWSMIGRYPWEITMPGIYDVDIHYKGDKVGTVGFEVT